MKKSIIQWHNTHLANTFKLLLSHTDLAHCVCCSIIDKDVQQAGGIASLNYRSSFHKLTKEGLGNYFSQYALCDAPVSRVGASKAAANNNTDIGDWECP